MIITTLWTYLALANHKLRNNVKFELNWIKLNSIYLPKYIITVINILSQSSQTSLYDNFKIDLKIKTETCLHLHRFPNYAFYFFFKLWSTKRINNFGLMEGFK